MIIWYLAWHQAVQSLSTLGPLLSGASEVSVAQKLFQVARVSLGIAVSELGMEGASFGALC